MVRIYWSREEWHSVTTDDYHDIVRALGALSVALGTYAAAGAPLKWRVNFSRAARDGLTLLIRAPDEAALAEEIGRAEGELRLLADNIAGRLLCAALSSPNDRCVSIEL